MKIGFINTLKKLRKIKNSYKNLKDKNRNLQKQINELNNKSDN